MVAHILQWQHSCSLGLLWVRISSFALDFFFLFYFEMWDMLFAAQQRSSVCLTFVSKAPWNLAPGTSLKSEVKGWFHSVAGSGNIPIPVFPLVPWQYPSSAHQRYGTAL